MTTLRAFAVLIVLSAPPAFADEDAFKCPAGAKDSGYKPGNVVRWCEIKRDGRLLHHGPVWRWHRNGKLESKEHYVNGNADGDTPSWYQNGQQSSHGTFKDGSKIGLWKYWDEQGRLTTEVTYASAGHLRTDYYPTGNKKATGTFKSSGKIGKWVYWDTTGNEKAQCDFGQGMFKVTSKPCQVIAEELDPAGYSRPLPIGGVGSGSACSLRLADQRYDFVTPSGWVADAETGKTDGVPLVFYRTGGVWRGAGPNLYVRPLFKDGASFEKIQRDEKQRFEEGVAEYKETASKKERITDGLEVVLRTIQYKSLIQTDSPFSIVADNTIHEMIGLVNASDEVVLMVVLTSPADADLNSSSDALVSLVRSVRARSR